MKTLSLFSKSEQTIRYLVLCDAPEREENDVASKQEIEALIREAVQEELEKEGKLNQASLEKALRTANARLVLACSGEPSVPGASAIVIAETTQNGKPYPEYLVGGVGDCRVYGIGKDKVNVAFSVPEKKRTRLGSGQKIEVHFTKISGKTYPTLVALPQQAYSRVNEKNWNALVGAPNLPEKARELIGSEAAQNLEGWIVIPGPVEKTPAKKKLGAATLGLVFLVVLAIAGTTLWIRERKKVTEGMNLSELTSSEPIEEIVAEEIPELTIEEIEEAQMRSEIVKMMEIDQSLVASLDMPNNPLATTITKQDSYAVPLDEEFSMIGNRFEEELNAHQTLLDEYKGEIAILRDALDSQEVMQESYGQLKQMLVEETDRFEQLEVALADKAITIETLETDLSHAQQAIAERNEQLDNLEEEQIAIQTDYDALTETNEATLASLDENQAIIANLQTNLEEIIESHQQLSIQKTSAAAEIELLKMALSEREEELGQVRTELTQLALVGEQNQTLGTQVEALEQYRAAYAHEHKLRLERDETLAALAVNIEGWRRAVESMERSREQLAQELAELRSAPKQHRRISREIGSVRRIHLVSPNETLESISHRYYSDFNRVNDIVDANNETLKGGHQVEVGMALVIP